MILTGLIKVLTSDNESTTSRAFCLHARCRLGSRASRQDQEVTSPAPEETSFCLQTVYLQPTLRAFYQLRSCFQPTRRRNFGLGLQVSRCSRRLTAWRRPRKIDLARWRSWHPSAQRTTRWLRATLLGKMSIMSSIRWRCSTLGSRYPAPRSCPAATGRHWHCNLPASALGLLVSMPRNALTRLQSQSDSTRTWMDVNHEHPT